MEWAEPLDPEARYTVRDRLPAIRTDGVHCFEGAVNQYAAERRT